MKLFIWDEEKVEHLLQNQLHPEQKDLYHRTALAFTAECGRLDLVQRLVLAGAKIKHKQEELVGLTPLHIAIDHGHVEIVKHFLSLGAHLEYESITGTNPLLLATYDGQLELIRELVNAGANVNDQKGKQTPLTSAAAHGHDTLVAYLLEKGADIEGRERNRNRRTALQAAIDCGRLGVVKLLIEAGANLEAKDDMGRTALMIALTYDDELGFANVLVESGADVNAVDDNGKFPLHYALQKGRIQKVKDLLHHGANLNGLFSDHTFDTLIRFDASLREYIEMHIDELTTENFKKWKAYRLRMLYY